MLWHHKIRFELVTGGWVQRAETLHFALSHSTGEDLLSHQVLSLAVRENCFSSCSLSYPSSVLPSICHRRLTWKTIWGSASGFHPEHLNFWHCLWQHPGVALSPLSFPPTELLISTAKTCILSAPYLSNHRSPRSTLPSKSVLLSQLLPNFPWQPQEVTTVILSGVVQIIQLPPFSAQPRAQLFWADHTAAI